jgi:hypothetical protein
MPPQKKNAKREPLLHSVARQLGRTVGIVANITHAMSDTGSEIAERLAGNKNDVAKILSPAGASDPGSGYRKKARATRSPRKRTTGTHRKSKSRKKGRPKARREIKPSDRKNKG